VTYRKRIGPRIGPKLNKIRDEQKFIFSDDRIACKLAVTLHPDSPMASDPSLGNIESLRVALMTLEHAAGSLRDHADLARVKHAILKRLADCEADLAIIDGLPPGIEKGEASELPGLMCALDLADFQALEEATADIPLHKLD
jgi:hypothetical protein